MTKLGNFFAGINFREWPRKCKFAGTNFRERQNKSRNRESLYPRKFIPIKYIYINQNNGKYTRPGPWDPVRPLEHSPQVSNVYT